MRFMNLLGAALALVMVPGVAAAEDCPQGSAVQGAASSGQDQSKVGCDASGNACTCPQQGTVGSAGGSTAAPSQPGAPPSGEVGGTAAEPSVTVISPSEEGAAEKKKDHGGGKGLTVALNGGVEGYTSSLAPRIEAGPAWGAMIAAAPSHRVGLELSYIGANNRVKDPGSIASTAGTRIIRNAGTADIRLSLLPTAFSPFIFGGIGINWASTRNDAPGSGYQNDTYGNIPLGAGADYHVGNFVAGARFTFNYLFDREFTPPTPGGAFGFSDKQSGDSYNGLVTVGGTF